MRAINILLFGISIALLCGCSKPTVGPIKWDYKVVEIENMAHADQHAIASPNSYDQQALTAYLDKVNSIKQDAGDFDFDSTNSYDDLSAIGADGWELVAAIPEIETTHPVGHDDVIAAVRTSKIVLIFKRPLN